MNYKLILAGAISGLASAVVVDLNAWSHTPGAPFDWGLALRRYIKGAITGALSASGFAQLGV